MNTWTARIRSRMEALSMTQERLAHKMGLTRGAITHYLAGRRVPPLQQFKKLAAVLKADPAWLQYGTSVKEKMGYLAAKETVKKGEIHTLQKRIPLLTWEQVAEWIDVTKLACDEIKEYVPHFYTDQLHWYALRVKGDAMTAPLGNSKSFHAGDMIIIDPTKKAMHGNNVIALLPRSKEVTFKEYVIDGGVHYLKPLNPQYPIVQISESTHICGVVVACINRF